MSPVSERVGLIRSVDGMVAEREALRRRGVTVGFVPTMGFLHAGHASLLRAARTECDVTVLSIFVNPTQFTDAGDLEHYPRDEGADLELAAAEGVDLVFVPEASEVYPADFATTVEVSGLTDVLCGSRQSRGSEHFRGVTTVVAKLLNLVDPDLAYFGQKDAQQAAVVLRMARDLSFRPRIAVRPTVREPDGLALSSRNARLSGEARATAAAIPKALSRAREVALTEGVEPGLEAGRNELARAGIEPEYFEARSFPDLEPVSGQPTGDWFIAVAAEVGGVRLIDNLPVGAGEKE